MVKLLWVLLSLPLQEEILPEYGDEELLYRIVFYSEHPLDLNSATLEELLDIPFMTKEIAEAILQYRKKDPFTSVDQLLLLEGVDILRFTRLKRFFRISRAKVSPPPGYTFLTRALYPIPDTLYDGPPEKLYFRFHYKKGNLKGGVVLEKDYYERAYPDYWNFFIEYRWFFLGSFDISEGLGLLFGKPGYFYKPSGIPETERGIVSHLSTYESGGLTGIAIKTRFFTTFLSYTKLDATIGDSSFTHYTSGYHRTDTELEKKDAVEEMIAGGIAKWKGLTLVLAYPRYTPVPPSGGVSPMISLSYHRRFAGYTGIFEGAYSSGMALGLALRTPMGFEALYRYFSHDYNSLRTAPFEQKEGIYLHLKRKLLELRTESFVDFVKSDSTYTPEAGFTGTWPVLKGTDIVLRWSRSSTRNNLRGEVIFQRKEYYMKMRLQYCRAEEDEGYGGYLTLGYRGNPSVEFRYATFSTDSYASAIYFYENNLPGEFSLVPLYGRGVRVYLLLREKNTGFYFRIASTIKADGINTNIGIALAR